MTSGADAPERVAIIKPCCIGDCIMSLPAVDAISAHWPTAEIDILTGRHSSVVYSFRPQHRVRRIPDAIDRGSMLRLGSLLNKEAYDIVVCLDRSRWLRVAVNLAQPRRSAFVKPLRPEQRHEIEVYLDVLRSAGVSTPASQPLIVTPDDEVAAAFDALPGLPPRFAVIHPGGARNPGVEMLEKRWRIDRYATVARQLSSSGLAVLLSGGDDDLRVTNEVALKAGISPERILAGRVDLRMLAAILSRASLYVGPDTGVSHLAAAVGTPSVAIFGPTNPRRYRPVGPNVQVVAPAASWKLPDRDLRRPIGEVPVSTEQITVEAVLTACRAVRLHDEHRQRCRG